MPNFSNRSIIELKESGELICELILENEKGKTFHPHEMFFISLEILRVKCGSRGWEDYLWREKNFLHFKKEQKSFTQKIKKNKLF